MLTLRRRERKGEQLARYLHDNMLVAQSHLGALGSGDIDTTDVDLEVRATANDKVKSSSSASFVHPLNGRLDALLERNLVVQVPCSVLGALAHPLSSPWRSLIIKASTSRHRKSEGKRSCGLSINVEANENVTEGVSRRRRPNYHKETIRIRRTEEQEDEEGEGEGEGGIL